LLLPEIACSARIIEKANQLNVGIGIGFAMAKRNNEPTSGADKAKVRVFFAEVEGNSESVQALRTMVSAMRRIIQNGHSGATAQARP
jgi:hypothetical protein